MFKFSVLKKCVMVPMRLKNSFEVTREIFWIRYTRKILNIAKQASRKEKIKKTAIEKIVAISTRSKLVKIGKPVEHKNNNSPPPKKRLTVVT